MIKPEDIPDDLVATLAHVLTARLDAYKSQYRSMVVSKLVEVRDGYRERSPEWEALDTVLRRLGAAPRDPASMSDPS